MKNFIEENLINRAISGDSAAFSEIYFALRDSIFGFAYRMLNDAENAEEITHDTFIFFIENPQKYDVSRGNLISFLCGVARNLILHRLRKNGRRIEISHEATEDFDEPNAKVQADPLHVLLEAELAEKVEAAITKLSPLLREVILLREMKEFSYEEIAAITGAEVGAVKVRLHRARKILAGELAQYFSKTPEKKSYEVC